MHLFELFYWKKLILNGIFFHLFILYEKPVLFLRHKKNIFLSFSGVLGIQRCPAASKIFFYFGGAKY
jgi:hypothetical protein